MKNSKNITSKLNSHNEWDKLKEVILGTAEGAQATLTWHHNSKNKMTEKNLENQKLSIKIYFYQVAK